MNSKIIKLSKALIVILLLGLLTSCVSAKPAKIVQDFLYAFKEGDFEKAGTYMADGNFNEILNEDDVETAQQILDAIRQNYEFGKPNEVSANGDEAKVEVEITSVDFGFAMTTTMAEVIPMAFATAFSEQTEESEKAFEDLMLKTAIKHLTSEDTPKVTRTVTLNLKKDKEGDYKIVSDENLEEAIFANMKSIENLFNEGLDEDFDSRAEL